jgi:hypothetical protein
MDSDDRHGPTRAAGHDRDARTVEITMAVLLAGVSFGAVLVVVHASGGRVHGTSSLLTVVAALAVAAGYLWQQRRIRCRLSRNRTR